MYFYHILKTQRHYRQVIVLDLTDYRCQMLDKSEYRHPNQVEQSRNIIRDITVAYYDLDVQNVTLPEYVNVD